jgi:hypothetical protein
VTIKYSIIFVSIFALLLLFANISNVNNLNVFAQNSTNSTAVSTTSKTNSGLKITYPEKESVVPTNSSSSFIVKGISKDNATADCKVSIIINNVKPYQSVQALGVNGKEDYSNWQYVLSKNYTNIVEGSNKITSKSSCLNDNPQNTYYSVNVTGMSPEQFKNYNQTNTSTLNNVSSLATIDPQQHPVAMEIQNIIKGSPDPSQFAFVVDNSNTNQDLNASSNPILNNTTPLVSNSTALNSTALNSTALNSTALNSTAFGLNSYSVVPVVSNSSIPSSTAFGTSNIIPVSLDSTEHKSDNSKSKDKPDDRKSKDKPDDRKSKDKPKSNNKDNKNVKKDKSKDDNEDGSSDDLASSIINKVKRNLSDAGIDI